jgi:hypothetical protein
MLGEWSQYTLENQSYIVLDIDQKPFTTGSHFRPGFVNYWTNVFPKLDEAVTSAKFACDVNTGTPLHSKSTHWRSIFTVWIIFLLKIITFT